MSPEHETTHTNQIDTSGGAVVDGHVNTGSGDFVGHDKIIHGDEVRGDKVLGDKITYTEEAAYSVYGLTNPYLGLRAFRYEDRAIYAGREQLAEETVQRLTAPGAQQTLLFITGASGSGKSSFAQAALIPLIESHYAAYQKTVRHAVFRPSSQPMVLLVDALQKLHPDLTAETLATNTPKDQINLLLIDQFEELFIQSAASQRAPFCDFLSNLPSFATNRTHIFITLRVDYLDELFAIQPLWAIAKEGVELRTMRADDLRNAIQKPLQVHHPQQRFAPELLDRLVQDAGADAALLPLLQVTLAELWKTGKLVLSSYHSLTDAIRQRAETVYAFGDHVNADPKTRRPADDQKELLSILLDLINVSADGTDRRDVRQRRTRQELEQGSPHRPRLIEELVNARLLAAANETRNGADVEVIDIIHESLIDNWDRLRNAIEEQRQQLQRRARFKLWMGEWLRNGRQDGYLLLTDMQLAEARVLVEGWDIEVRSAEAKEFYQRSVDHREAEREKELQRVKELADAQRRRAQTFRWALIVASVLLMLIGATAWYARNRQIDADKKATEARVAQSNAEQAGRIALSRQLAAQSANELGKNNYELAILLAIESGKVTDTFESFSAIRAAISNPWHSRFVLYSYMEVEDYRWDDNLATWNQDESKILMGSKDGVALIWDASTGRELIKFEGHTSSVTQATWSQDESKILTASWDGTARIWNATTGKELVKFDSHSADVNIAMWSQDESQALTVGFDHIVRVWNTESGKELIKLEGHTGGISQANWNQNENKILTASWDKTVRIWDAINGIELVKFEGQIDRDQQAIWSQDEKKVVSLIDNKTACIWDAASGIVLVKFSGHSAAINHVTWSQDESKILTSSDDKTVRLWDATTGKELVKFEGHTDRVWQATWSQDESKILTNGNDRTVRIWDAQNSFGQGKELIKLDGHTNSVNQAAWNQDESKILTVSSDKTMRIWDAATGKELLKLKGHVPGMGQSVINQATWSQDESKILTSGADGTVRIWDTTSGWEQFNLERQTNYVTWSQDESKILTRDNDNKVHIWDAASGKELVRFEGHTDSVWQVTWSQNESELLTSSTDGTVRIWNAINGQELVKLEDHMGSILHVTWSQNETKILTISNDKIVRIWKVDEISGRHPEMIKFEGHTNYVSQATWNRDESKILTTSHDGTARIWDATNGEELVRLNGHKDKLWSATWNQDENKILTSEADDGTARIWDAVSGKELLKFEGVYNAIWNQDESKILTSRWNKAIRIFSTETGEELVKLEGYRNNTWEGIIWSRDQSKILAIIDNNIVCIWNASTGTELLKFEGHTDTIYRAIWNHDESKILTGSWDGTVRIWDATTSKELSKFEVPDEIVRWVGWNQDESKILTTSVDGTARIWYVHMADLLVAACTWVPRNFTWSEWQAYMADDYRPTCPNAPTPPDAITAIQEEARQQIQAGQVVSATQRLDQLNGWLQVNGQFKNYGVAVPTFVAEVAATATAEAMPSPAVTPEWKDEVDASRR